MERNQQNMNPAMMMEMNRITVEEFRAHIEEEDFFRRYGNPVFITREGKPGLVCMAWEYCKRLLSQISADEDPAD